MGCLRRRAPQWWHEGSCRKCLTRAASLQRKSQSCGQSRFWLTMRLDYIRRFQIERGQVLNVDDRALVALEYEGDPEGYIDSLENQLINKNNNQKNQNMATELDASQTADQLPFFTKMNNLVENDSAAPVLQQHFFKRPTADNESQIELDIQDSSCIKSYRSGASR